MIPNQFTVQEGNPLATEPIPCAMCGQPFKVGDAGVLIPMPGVESGYYLRSGEGNTVSAVPVHVPCMENANDLFQSAAEFGRFVLMVMEGTRDWDADMMDLIAGKAVNLGLARTNEAGMFETRFNHPAGTPAETMHSDQPASDTNENSERTDDSAGGPDAQRGTERAPGA